MRGELFFQKRFPPQKTVHKILETVPNFSEGRNAETVERIADCFRGVPGVKLLDYSSDADHNRTVVTAAGEPAALLEAVVNAAGAACARIDLTKHTGQHPRIGAVDVIPFIPIQNVSEAEALALAREAGAEIAARYGIPVFFYEKSAAAPHRANLSEIRKGQFEGLAEKMRDARWRPDCGPAAPHPTAGVTAVGVRAPLIAFNVNLETSRLDIAAEIARRVRHSSGGLPCVKAMGVELKQRGQAQVSMNLTDYTQTSIYTVFERVKAEAERLGVNVASSELIGLMPLQALAAAAASYLKLESFSVSRILETRLFEETPQ